MARFILVHGAAHGGWCWEKIVPLLQEKGHHVLAPDLPGAGDDHTLLGDITLPSYVQRILSLVDAEPEPVILVGHSMGGVTISEVAETRPEKLRCLVYICALMLPDGTHAREITGREPGSLLMRSLEFSQDGYSYTYKKSNVPTLFYNDCAPEDVFKALPRLRPMPRAISTTPVRVTPQNYGRVPRAYIECRRDQTITIELQHYMEKVQPPDRVITMGTGHSPFFSAPEELSEHLHAIAEDPPVRRG